MNPRTIGLGAIVPADLQRFAGAYDAQMNAARRLGYIGSTARPQPAARAATPAPVPRVPRQRVADGVGTLAMNGTFDAAMTARVAEQVQEARDAGDRVLLACINSTGGAVSTAAEIGHIFDHWRHGGGRIVAYVGRYARADSAATLALLEADFAIVDPAAIGATVHAAKGGAPGMADLATDRIADVYARRALLGDRHAIRNLLADRDTLLRPWEAVRLGFADDVADEDHAMAAAQALAKTWPSWPANLNSERHQALELRACGL